MIKLSTFIQSLAIRHELERNCVYISTIAEADAFAFLVSRGTLKNVIFETTSLKSYAFNKIQTLCEANIINCNSTLDRFCESLEDGLNIFDNIDKCKNEDILSIVLNNKGILSC